MNRASASHSSDVIIVGGGPAGSSAAMVLAQSGLSVSVIDQATFPRDKLCGGLLTQRAAKVYRRIFPEPWDAVIEAQTRAMHLHDGSLASLPRLNGVSQSHLLQFTKRLHFDHFLLQQAQAAGAHLALGSAVREIELAGAQDLQRVVLRNGTVLQAKILIGADGVNSRVAKALGHGGLDPEHTALALEVEVPRAWLKQTMGEQALSEPEIYFGLVHWGYAWVFPKRDTLTVGLGGLLARNPQLKDDLRLFLQRRFPHAAVDTLSIKGHHLPYGRFLRRPGRGNTLLCGDAAGLVEPITGEGIAFAMQSGAAAAQAARRSLHEGGLALHHYDQAYRQLCNDLRWANRLRHLVFAPRLEKSFLQALPTMTSAPQRMMDLMADELSYPAWSAHIAQSVAKRIWRRLGFKPAPRSGH